MRTSSRCRGGLGSAVAAWAAASSAAAITSADFTARCFSTAGPGVVDLVQEHRIDGAWCHPSCAAAKS
jgi:hypothetical protein